MKGFALIESMIAFALIGFGIVGAVKLQDVLIRNSVYSRQLTEATLICQQEMELLRSYSAKSGFDALASNVAGNTIAGVSATYTRSWQVSTNAFGSKIITVNASWLGVSNAQESVTLSSAISYIDPVQSALLAITPP